MSLKKQKVKISVDRLPVAFFKEGDAVVAYCHVLDLTACGDTTEQADANFQDAFQIFFSECLKKGTLGKALSACGWRVRQDKHCLHVAPPLYLGEHQIPVSDLQLA